MKRFMLISLMSCMFMGQVFCADKPAVAKDSDSPAWSHFLRGAAFPVAGATCGFMAGAILNRATDGSIPLGATTVLGALAGGYYARSSSESDFRRYQNILGSKSDLRDENRFRLASDLTTIAISGAALLSLPQVTVYLKNGIFDKVVKA